MSDASRAVIFTIVTWLVLVQDMRVQFDKRNKTDIMSTATTRSAQGLLTDICKCLHGRLVAGTHHSYEGVQRGFSDYGL